MAAIPITHSLILAAILFVLGLIGVLVRRNIIFILLCLEIMLNAAGLAFITAGSHLAAAGTTAGQPDGQVMFFFILTVTAAEVSIGLALVLQLHHRFKTLDVDAASRMRG
jgi:NADH-quinone oxidoreductase subunit K